jgi:hypothetical protein
VGEEFGEVLLASVPLAEAGFLIGLSLGGLEQITSFLCPEALNPRVFASL